ncbi:MAG TPA: enoyl-CoA hydratase/isomerase family protein [Dehalococcoidia bacterium]|nr:enoyl-CoA hydratase/isomerase family protein [Dehalococcoidia bacterium]
MKYENLMYEKDEGIAKITINRPKVMNALSPAVLSEIKAALQEASKDDDVRVVVLTGAGRAYSAGADLLSLEDRKLEGGAIGPILDDPGRDVIDTIQTIPKVVIAMINGYCLTGALEISLACDLIIASEEAKFGDTHTRWGLRPSWGMSQRLPRTLGLLKAKELSFTAETITAQEAERIGLVNMTVPAEKLEGTVQELARKIMANSLETIAAYKYLYNRGMRDSLEKGLELESKSKFVITDTDERLEKFRKKH